MQTFQPLVGSSFDNLGAQSQFWAGFNGQIENANIARATEAADKASRYNLLVSQAQREDAFRQAALDEAARRSAIVDAQNFDASRRHNYEFGVNADLSREANRIQKQRYEFADTEKKTAEAKANTILDRVAENAAPGLSTAAQKRADAQKEFQDSQSTLIKEATAQLSSIAKANPLTAPKLIIDRSGNLIAQKGMLLDEKENLLVNNANAALAAVKADHAAADDRLRNIENNWAILTSRLPKELQVDELGKIFNPYAGDKGKSYGGFVTPTAPEAGYVPDTTTAPANPFGPSMNVVNPDTSLANFAGGNPAYQFNGGGATSVLPSPSPLNAPAPPVVVAPPAPVIKTPPPRAILDLKSNPKLAPEFDLKYGQGSAAKILGASVAPAVPTPLYDPATPMRQALRGGASYLWNSGPVQGVRDFFSPGQPDPALQSWIHEAPAQ